MKKTGISLSLLALAALVSPASATAPAGALKMPDYFVNYAVDMTVADRVVTICKDLIMNPVGVNRLNVSVEAQLHEDGLLHLKDDQFAQAVRDSLDADNRLETRLGAVYKRMGINPTAPADRDQYCKAGRAEISAKTEIGQLLLDTQ